MKTCLLMMFLSSWIMVASGACDKEFSSYNQLNELRVLAIRAEPPWLNPGQSTTLDALVYNSKDADLKYTWSWCPKRGNSEAAYACEIAQDELELSLYQVLEADKIPQIQFNLGNQSTASFEYSDNLELWVAICNMVNADNTNNDNNERCSGSIDITVELTVQAQDEIVHSFKQIKLQFLKQETDNTNPNPQGIRICTGDCSQEEATPVPEMQPLLSVNATKSYHVFADLLQDAADEFMLEGPTDPITGEIDQIVRQENLNISWFTELGSLERINTNDTQNNTDTSPSRIDKWTLPQAIDATQNQTDIYLVVRDNRGGVGWLKRSVSIEME